MEYNGYKIESEGGWGMKVIKSIGKGAIPQALRGNFSNTFYAKQAIDVVLAQKDNKNVEVVSSV